MPPTDLEVARRFVDAAVAAGALYVFAVHDDWNTRGDPALSAYRGVPLVDTAAFLRHIDSTRLGSESIERGESEVAFKLPHSLGPVQSLCLTLDLSLFSNTDSEAPQVSSKDLSLCCVDMAYSKGYLLTLRDSTDDEVLLELIYTPGGKASAGGRAGATLLGRRGDYKRKHDDM